VFEQGDCLRNASGFGKEPSIVNSAGECQRVFFTERSFSYRERAAEELFCFSIASGSGLHRSETNQRICGIMNAVTLSEGFLFPADLFEG